MQANAPEGALGRVFVRYEVVFQLSWVAGALAPAVLAIDFKAGMLIMAAFYLALAGAWAVRFFRRPRGRSEPRRRCRRLTRRPATARERRSRHGGVRDGR